MAQIRVILADDHAIVLSGLQRLFDSEPDLTVVESCRNGDDALAAVRRGVGDVLLLDLRMPGLTGLDVLRRMHDEKQACRVVLLTASIGDDDVVEAVRLGVRGVVLKESSPEVLLECVRKVHQGQQWIDGDTMSRAFGRVMRRETAVREVGKILTAREIEIVSMIAQGLRNKAIADKLGITEGTVKIHLHHIFEKTGVNGRLELALWARTQGMV